MIAKLGRGLREEESGQALVLGAVAVLVLAVAVMSTVQLGHAIHERIRLQDAADDAAWSAAVLVARSLNGIAWINRTLAAQYVSAMAAQSMVAALDGYHALVGLAADLLQTMAAGACATRAAVEVCCASGVGAATCCPAAGALAALGPVLVDGAAGLRSAADGIAAASRRLDPTVARFVRLVSEQNLFALHAAQLALREAAAAALGAPGDGVLGQVLRETAGSVDEGVVGRRYQLAMSRYNLASYERAFDRRGAEALPPRGGTAGAYSDEEPAQNAEKLMAELANGSRWRWESGHGFSAAHSAGALGAAGAALHGLTWEHAGASRLVAPMTPAVFSEGSNGGADASAPGSAMDGAWGADRVAAAAENNYVFMNYSYLSEFTRGGALASAESVRSAFAAGGVSGGRATRVVGIQAAVNPGQRFHCRYDGRELRTLVPGCPPYARTRPVRCTPEAAHEFWGITRYLSFALAPEPGRDFGQPDFVVLAHKTSRQAQLPADLGMGWGGTPLRVSTGARVAAFDPAAPRSRGEGLHAWARAVTYYHRPGAWAEPPNLFNPFWRARLAPVSPRLDVFLDAAALGPTSAEARLVGARLVH